MSGDVHLFHVPDHGEVEIAGGDLARSASLASAVYLSIWGGNHHDVGRGAEREQWWGNYGEPQARQLRGEAAALIEAGFPTRPKALALEQALLRDTTWIIDAGLATEIAVTINLGTSRIAIDVAGEEVVVKDGD